MHSTSDLLKLTRVIKKGPRCCIVNKHPEDSVLQSGPHPEGQSGLKFQSAVLGGRSNPGRPLVARFWKLQKKLKGRQDLR